MKGKLLLERTGISVPSQRCSPGDPPDKLEVVDGVWDGGKIRQLVGVPSALTPDNAPEELFEIAEKLCKFSLTNADGLYVIDAMMPI